MCTHRILSTQSPRGGRPDCLPLLIAPNSVVMNTTAHLFLRPGKILKMYVEEQNAGLTDWVEPEGLPEWLQSLPVRQHCMEPHILTTTWH